MQTERQGNWGPAGHTLGYTRLPDKKYKLTHIKTFVQLYDSLYRKLRPCKKSGSAQRFVRRARQLLAEHALRWLYCSAAAHCEEHCACECHCCKSQESKHT